MRRTKIVATIGPATDSPGVMRRLVEAGVDVVRLNFSHDRVENHLARLALVRQLAADAGRHVAVLQDLPGPKVRAAPFPDEPVVLTEGQFVRLAPGTTGSTAEVIEVDYPTLVEDVHPGDLVVLGDGAVVLVAADSGPAGVAARVMSGGRVQGRPGVHLPSERSRVETPTEADLAMLEAGVAAGVDLVAVSFVRRASHVERVREAAGGDGPLVVAKIETSAAMLRLDEIVEAADVLMVARGDLGIDCPAEDVPHFQKRIVRTCVERGRPVITATQVLESMVSSPVPTRAEAADVANAVFDGTDALMLSAETAIGRHPVEAVETMARIAARAEREADYPQWGARVGRRPWPDPIPGAITHAAWQAALDAGAAAILCPTRTGATVRAMARFRPTATLVGLAHSERVARQLAVTWGAVPLTLPQYATTEEMVREAVAAAATAGLVGAGDVVAVTAGWPGSEGGQTDLLRLVRAP
jgi:pyruvate kinase